MGKEQYVAISHFINPHLFWYHNVDGQNPAFVEQRTIEDSIQGLFTAKQSVSLCPHRPQIGEIVAVAFVSWNKYIRARVEYIEKYTHTEDQYIVWALDYGFPFHTKLSFIRKLPDSYKQITDHIRTGGIANILPAELEFEFVTTTSKLTCTKSWSQRAIELLEKVINDAASVSFIEEFCDSTGLQKHRFGDLKIINHSGNEFFVSDYLIKLNYAVKCVDDFAGRLKKIETTCVPCWESVNRNNKIIQNKLSSFNINFANQSKSDRTGSLSETSSDLFAKQKVIDWCERNQNIDKIVDEGNAAVPVSGFDATDISFDDSVSVKNCESVEKHADVEETVMGCAGALHKARKDKYKENVMPPKPPLDVFEVIPESEKNEVNKSVASALSKRTRALMELRKKHHQQEAATPVVNNSAPEEEMANLSLSSQSGCGTDEFLATCKQRNAQNILLKESREQSSDSPAEDSGSVSITSSRIQRLQKIKQKYAEQRTKEIHGNQIAQSASNVLDEFEDVQGRSDSRISSHVAKLIDIRRRVHAKYSQPDKDDDIFMGKNVEKTVASLENREPGYLMPQLNTKFSRLDLTKSQQQDYVAPSVSKPELSSSASDSSTSRLTVKKKDQVDLRKMLNENPFKNMAVVPAGFDVTKLVPRHNKDTHWHTRKSTLNETLHSNQRDNAVNTANTNGNQEKVSRRTEDVEQQNFRLTGSRKERKKPVEEKHLLDQSLNDIDCMAALSPIIVSTTKTSDSVEKLIDLSVNSESPDKSSCSASGSSDSFVKFLKAKSPVVECGSISMDLLAIETESDPKPNSKDSSSISTGSFTKISSTINAPENLDDKHQDREETSTSSVEHETSVLTKLKSSSSTLSAQDLLAKVPLIGNDTSRSSSDLSLKQHPEPTKPAKQNGKQLDVQPLNIPDIPGEAALKTNLIQHLVLAHSKIKVTPIDRMASALFPREIHQEMENMRMTKIYRIQSYAWSHLVRGNSFFVINGSRTGKSWCYLPSLCSMVGFRLQSESLPQSYGPVAVIIAPSSKQVESLARQCRYLLGSTKTPVTVVPSYAFRCAADVKIELLNGCGILVITPPSLRRLLIANETELLINRQRIQYVVIDDMDKMLDIMEDFNDVMDKFIGPMVHQQDNNGKVPFQMAVTSKRWSKEMVKLMRISNQPLLCIADFLEAAVYARAKISIKLQSSGEKMSMVIKCLEKCSYSFERVVIVCSTTEEVDEVEKCLLDAGYPSLAYTDCMLSDVLDLVHEWRKRAVCHQILIVMDAVLPEITVQNAWTLIHYSLPTSWTRFNFRFSTFLQNYDNLLANDYEKPSIVPKSLILLDENNNLQLPRLMDFMKKHKQLKHVHPDIQDVAAKVEAEREEQRVAQGILMCPEVLEFGACDESNRCPHRHQLTKYDGPMDDIPSGGDIRLILLDVASPTHYIARLLTHRDAITCTWNVIKRSDEVAQFLMRLSLHFLSQESHTAHWPLRVNDLCVYKGEGIYHRCRLLEVPSIVYENIVKLVNVKVKLIDTGTVLTCRSYDLLVIPEEFRDFPAQAVDIRLSGVVPFDNEKVWDSRSTRAVRQWIMSGVKENDCLQASVNFALMKTIWVDNVILMEKLPTIRGFAVKINVKRSLIGKEFALASDQVHSIKQTAIEMGLLESKEIEDVTLDESNGMKDETNLMEFPKSTSFPFTENDSKPNNHQDNKDTELTQDIPVRKPTSKPVPSKSSLKSAEEWQHLKLEELQQVKFKELRDPGKFYVRLQRYTNELNDLEEIIRDQTKLPLNEPHPMQNCLAPKDGKYYRAKIKRLLIDSDGCVQARVFFCDLGCFASYSLKELRATSKMLIEFMPFQAICCKLTGLHVEKVGDEIQNILNTQTGVHMSYAVKESFDSEDYDKRFHIRHYEIVLYECFSGNKDIIINKLLVERGLASYDDETKHYLEFEKNASIEQNDDELCNTFDFTAFLERVRQQMDEEDAEDDEELPTHTYNHLSEETVSETKIAEITDKDKEKQTKKNDTDSPSKVNNNDSGMPALKPLYKRPETTWYQTVCMIFLVIRTPDVTDYHLEVTPNRLTFIASINGEKHLLILDLLGYVVPELVSHEIRGLNVVVRLVKSVYMEWPRLLKDPTKVSWLNYNYNSIDAAEEERLLESGFLRRRGKRSRHSSNESDASTNSDSNPWETFTPIVNGDELHDPIGDFF